MSTQGKDLTKVSPASPHRRVGGYVILARMADKARAEFMGGNISDYHTDCPLDHMLLDWKGVGYDEVKKELLDGADDSRIATYLDSHGTTKTAEEVKEWSDGMDEANPYFNPEKKEWFAGECATLGLDPAKTTLFDWLDSLDKSDHSA